MFKPILIVPFYNHVQAFEKNLKNFQDTGLPVLIVDDGSEKEQSDRMRELCKKNNFQFIRLPLNKGKGQAVITGMKKALEQNYTHALQIDADGQHNFSDIPLFLTYAKKHPDRLINGCPVYGQDVPKSRLYGRKITNFWVCVETFSPPMDAMCGFRVYPLKRIENILSNIRFLRMGFDIEILVKTKWLGIDVLPLKTAVIYPKDGVSHFRAIKDNVLISCLHTYLCCLMPFVLIKKGVKKCKMF